MKIVSISDSHSFLLSFDNEADMENCQFLIHSGDLTNNGNENQTERALIGLKELGIRIKAKNIIIIGGNHDDYLESIDPEIILQKYGIHLINNKTKNIDGYTFGGYVAFPPEMNWAFNTVIPHEILPKLSDIDFLITHSPPYGILDEVLAYESHISGQNKYHHLGDKILADFILDGKFTKLKALFCGHAHEGRGEFIMDNGLVLINSCILDEYFQKQGNPIITILDL